MRQDWSWNRPAIDYVELYYSTIRSEAAAAAVAAVRSKQQWQQLPRCAAVYCCVQLPVVVRLCDAPVLSAADLELQAWAAALCPVGVSVAVGKGSVCMQCWLGGQETGFMGLGCGVWEVGLQSGMPCVDDVWA
jgi:hypothetical protein